MKALLYEMFVGDLSLKRMFRSLLLIPLFVYIGLLIVAFFFADNVLFRPPAAFYTDTPQVLKLSTANGDRISAKFYENPSSKFTILFSHGNAEDIGTIESFILKLQDTGFSVLSYDYRGYGTSDGIPSEEHCYEDIDAAYRYLVEIRNIAPNRIILHGRSLGGGVSVDLAARREIAGLIMESTFTSASRVLSRYKIIPFDKFESINKVGKVAAPVLVIHGREDWTIPFHHGESILSAAREPKRSFWVNTAGHNNLFRKDNEGYLKAMNDFADSLPFK